MMTDLETQFSTDDGEQNYFQPIADLIRAEQHDLAKDTLTRATNLMVQNSDFITALNEAMRQFAVDRNVEAVINVLKNRYDLL